MEGFDIKENITKQNFMFYDGSFIFMTGNGEKNKIAVFCDEITDKARDYADSLCPVCNIAKSHKDKMEYYNKTSIDYWSSLFNIAIWDILEKKGNIVSFMKND